MIRSLTRSTINNEVWYQSMLVGNEAYNPTSFDLLATTLVTSNTASVTFNSLSSYSGYTHLQIRMSFRTSDASPLDGIDLYFNGVNTGTTYSTHRLVGSGGSVFSSSQISGASMGTVAATPGNNATANVFGAAVIEILDFLSPNKNKTIKSLSGHTAIGSTTQIRLTSGFRNLTDALTSLTILPNSGTNLVAGSRFSLYGIKG